MAGLVPPTRAEAVLTGPPSYRFGGRRPGHPRLCISRKNSWMPGTRPGMTTLLVKTDRLRRGVGERVHDVGDDRIDELHVVALGHDADHRLRARRADDEAPGLAEPRFAAVDRLAHGDVVQRLMAVLVADVLQDLRQRLEAVADFAHRLAALRHHGEDLKCGDQAVAGGR